MLRELNSPEPDSLGPATKRGRRKGGSNTRAAIIEAGRSLFAVDGFDGVSMRQVARAAGVDAAMVHHYFDSKDELFAACVAMPADPRQVLAGILDSQPSERGAALLKTILELWDSPLQPALLAMVRSALSSPTKASLLRQFLEKVILGQAFADLPGSLAEKHLRASLLVSQIFGLIVARHVLKLEPLASASIENILGWVGPTVQRYLTGDLDGEYSPSWDSDGSPKLS